MKCHFNKLFDFVRVYTVKLLSHYFDIIISRYSAKKFYFIINFLLNNLKLRDCPISHYLFNYLRRNVLLARFLLFIVSLFLINQLGISPDPFLCINF